jgi:hypothetical protein
MLPRPPTIRHERDLMVGRGREVNVAPKKETDIQLLDDRRLVARFHETQRVFGNVVIVQS